MFSNTVSSKSARLDVIGRMYELNVDCDHQAVAVLRELIERIYADNLYVRYGLAFQNSLSVVASSSLYGEAQTANSLIKMIDAHVRFCDDVWTNFLSMPAAAIQIGGVMIIKSTDYAARSKIFVQRSSTDGTPLSLVAQVSPAESGQEDRFDARSSSTGLLEANLKYDRALAVATLHTICNLNS